MIDTAVKFLRNPKVKDSPLSRKMSFLAQKGLTPGEIEVALETVQADAVGAGAGAGSWAGGNAGVRYPPGSFAPPPPGYPMAPASPPLTWKDYFIGAVVGGTALYGGIVAAQEYLIPRMGWFGGETAKQLEDLNTSVTELNASYAERSEQISAALEVSVDTCTEMKEQLRGVVSRVAALEQREDLAAAATKRSGDTVAEEVRQLKSLFVNRRAFAASPAGESPPTPTPTVVSNAAISAPTTPRSTSNVDRWARMIAPRGSNDNAAASAVATTEQNEVGRTVSAPAIPSWQRSATLPPGGDSASAVSPAGDSGVVGGAAAAPDAVTPRPEVATPAIPTWQRSATIGSPQPGIGGGGATSGNSDAGAAVTAQTSPASNGAARPWQRSSTIAPSPLAQASPGASSSAVQGVAPSWRNAAGGAARPPRIQELPDEEENTVASSAAADDSDGSDPSLKSAAVGGAESDSTAKGAALPADKPTAAATAAATDIAADPPKEKPPAWTDGEVGAPPVGVTPPTS